MKDKQKYEPNFCVWPQTRFNCSTVLEIPSSSLSIRQGVSGNKAGKRQQFLEAEQHLLWAIGGNLSSPQCGPSDTGGSKYNRSDVCIRAGTRTLYDSARRRAKLGPSLLV